MKGSASRPSSATMNGTRWAIRPATKATSRDRRVQLGNNYAALRRLCSGQRCGQLRAPVQGVRALTSFSFDKLSRNSEGFASGEVIDSGPLGIKAEAGAVLALRRNPKICNRLLHVQSAYHRMRFGRSANKSNIVAVFMLQQHDKAPSFSLLRDMNERGPPAATILKGWHVAGREISAPLASCGLPIGGLRRLACHTFQPTPQW